MSHHNYRTYYGAVLALSLLCPLSVEASFNSDAGDIPVGGMAGVAAAVASVGGAAAATGAGAFYATTGRWSPGAWALMGVASGLGLVITGAAMEELSTTEATLMGIGHINRPPPSSHKIPYRATAQFRRPTGGTVVFPAGTYPPPIISAAA